MTIKTQPDLSRLQTLEVGTRILVNCPNLCNLTDKFVIGNKIYSPDTQICASAYHAGILKRGQYSFYMIISKGLSCYFASDSGGVSSQMTTTPGAYSISFMDLNFTNFLPFVNMQLDFVVPGSTTATPVYVSGTVKAVEATSDGANLMITPAIKIPGSPEAGYPIYWPSSAVDFCGEKIPNETCNPESRRPDKLGLF